MKATARRLTLSAVQREILLKQARQLGMPKEIRAALKTATAYRRFLRRWQYARVSETAECWVWRMAFGEPPSKRGRLKNAK